MAKIQVGNVKCSIIPFIDGSHIKYSEIMAVTPLNIFIRNNAQIIRGGGVLNNSTDSAGYKYNYVLDNVNNKITYSILNPQGSSVLSFYDYLYGNELDRFFIVMFCQRESDGRLGIFGGGGTEGWPWWPNGRYVNGNGSGTPGEYLYPNREPHIVNRGEQLNVTTSDLSSIQYCSLSDNNELQSLRNLRWLSEADSNAIRSGISTDESPYTNGPINKGTKGGDGKWVNPQPPNPVPSLPWQQILNAGLLNCYEVDHADLVNIASFMFDADVGNELMKIGTDLYDYIAGLFMVPVNVTTSGTDKLALGNAFLNPLIQHYVTLPKVSEQYYEIDCGYVTAEEYWGNALDYNPYTRVTLMLPYIGAKEISADEVMGKQLHLKYHIDILSGACVAYLYELLAEGGHSVIYQFSGNCIMQLPLNSTDHNNLLSGVLQTAVAGVVGAATAGAGLAAVAAAGTASQTAAAHITAEKQFASNNGEVVTGIASNVIGAKVNVERSSNISGAAGFLGIQTPYLLIQRPTQAYPENFGHYKGFPCNQELKLGDLQGYTVVDSIILNGLVGTEPEIAEIYDLLGKGVII